VKVMQQWGPPPYKPKVRAVMDVVVATLRKNVQAIEHGAPDPGLTAPACTWGFPMVMIDSPLMFEILPTPEETIMVFSGRETRHIYTDGRPHTPKEDLWPTYWGDSNGRWEGTTLVIDTIAVQSPFNKQSGDVPIFAWGGGNHPGYELIAVVSSQVHFIERIRMLDKNHLEDRMTIIDPVNFAASWHVNRTYRRVEHLHRMVHEDCTGEDRNPIVNGRYTLVPPPASPQPPPAESSH